jgi:hypothetical protein
MAKAVSLQLPSQIMHRRHFDWLSTKLGIQKQEDWYNVTVPQLAQVGARKLISQYTFSISTALQTVYPEFNWVPWFFQHAPHNFWTKTENCREYLDWFASLFSIETQEDWYRVHTRTIKRNGGSGLLHVMKGSLHKALQESYPEFDWHPWLFAHSPAKYWDKIANRRKCLDWIAAKLNIEKQEQWLRLNTKKLKKLTGGAMIHRGPIRKVLADTYPEYIWTNEISSSDRQYVVSAMLHKCFSTMEQVVYNHKIWSTQTKSQIELDLYFPSLHLAIEYQGEQHYKHIGYGNFHLDERKAKDEEKRNVCKSLGISLVEVPYWWNLSLPKLITTIHRLRPDLKLTLTHSHS